MIEKCINIALLVSGLMLLLILSGFSSDEAPTGKPRSVQADIDRSAGMPNQPPAATDEPAATSSRTGEEINWQVISSGGQDGSSSSYSLSGTIGQTAVGPGSSVSYGLNSGYWQDFSGSSGCATPGDANGNGVINILDITYLINYLYKGGPAPVPFPVASGDPNCNCVINILDITHLINYLYKGGPAPCDCTQWLSTCG